MAEGIARQLLEQRGLDKQIAVVSAGIAAFPGDRAAPQAIAALEEQGIDLTGHRARILTVDLVETVNLVLTMTRAHRHRILELVPTAESKVYVLKEYGQVIDSAKETGDIPDPIGQSLARYREVAQELREYIHKALEKI
jgi:protein-tyrosine-phosphatase